MQETKLKMYKREEKHGKFIKRGKAFKAYKLLTLIHVDI